MSHRISQAIRCSLDSHEIYRTAVRELGSYLDVDRCSLFMRNDRARCATNVAEYHNEGVQPAASDFPLAHLQTLITALDNTGVLVSRTQSTTNGLRISTTTSWPKRT